MTGDAEFEGGSETPLLAVDARGLRRSFGNHVAVDGLDLQVKPGEIVAFLGPNGAGKTTSIDMFLGLGKPDSGSVRVFGMQPRAAVQRGLVAAVMQTGGLLDDLSVKETMRLTASLFSDTQSVDEAMEQAGISRIADSKVKKCSGGEKQRLRYAMALLSDPALLILDEPTTGMDVEGRQAFWARVRENAERGQTVLFATHYLEEADSYADRVVLIRRGKVVADGTPAQIKAVVGGRTVRATVDSIDRMALAGLDSVQEVEVNGRTLLVHTSDSDAVARYLLNNTEAHDIEITARGLEDAFVALTIDEEQAQEEAR